MNLASIYLCLFMNINTSAKLLWNAISFFFFLQVCLWAIYDMKLKFHSYSTTSCEYDNVEVKEKSVMCHAS